jgi:hypothetical protein
MQNIPAAWLAQLDELLALSETGPDGAQDARLVEQVAALDPDLLAFLIQQLTHDESAQAAALLELLAATPATPAEARGQARGALETLAERGITTAPPGEERFYAGWVQEGRERGEQILILGWRLVDGDLEALVFLLDWRGDGLKDFYRTRRMNAGEWAALIEHNGHKGAPLVELTLAEARALLEAALAESRRFSRPLPREYKVDGAVIERRILQAADLPQTSRAFISPALAPDSVVCAYVAALHHRDYALAALLLAPEHPLRAGCTVDESAAELRAQLKHAPRRDEAVTVTPADSSAGAPDADAQVTLRADGTETAIERHTNRRTRQAVAEQYTLCKTGDGWRIAAAV